MAFTRTTDKTGGKNNRKSCLTGAQLRRARRAGPQAEEPPSVTSLPSPEPVVAPSLEPLVLSRRARRLLRRATASAASAAPHDDAPGDNDALDSTGGGKIGHKLSDSASSTDTALVAWQAGGRGSIDSNDGSADSAKSPLVEEEEVGGSEHGKREALRDAATTDGTPSTSTSSSPPDTTPSTTGTDGLDGSSTASTGDQALVSKGDATTGNEPEAQERCDAPVPSEELTTPEQQCVAARKPLSASARSFTPVYHEHIQQQEGYSTPASSPNMYGAMGQVPPCNQAEGLYVEPTHEQQLAAMAQRHQQQIADWQLQHQQEFLQWQQAQWEQAQYEQTIYAQQQADAVLWQEQQAMQAQHHAMYGHQQWQEQEAIQWQQQQQLLMYTPQQWQEQQAQAMYGFHHQEAMYNQQYHCSCYNCEPQQAQWYPQNMDPAWQCNPHGATYDTYNYQHDGTFAYPMAPEAVAPRRAEGAPRRRRRHRGGKGSRGRQAPVAF